jgi:hypothetical protein
MPFLHVAGYVDLRQGVFTKLDMSGSVIGQELRLSSEGKPPLARIIQRGDVRLGDDADRGVIFRGVEDAGIGV